MQNILVNDDFGKSISRLRAILPVLSFTLLISTYLISAIIMGIFHAQNAPNTGFLIAAFLIPLAIQAGRGTLVFFFQLNPAHIQSKYSFGLIAATALLILSLIEAVLVMYPYGFSWVISVSTLMVIGYVLEIMILKETIFATQMELFQSEEKWREVKEFYIRKNELQSFIKDLSNGQSVNDQLQSGSIVEQQIPVNQVQTEENQALALLTEINQHLEGKELRPSMNGQLKGKQ